jgi:hypothetical protein
MFLDGGFEVAQANRLEPHFGVVKVLNRRLDEENTHVIATYILTPYRYGNGCIARQRQSQFHVNQLILQTSLGR